MPEQRHLLDRRANSAASAMRERIHALVDVLGPGVPFTQRVPLSWWVENIDQPAGQEAMKRLGPLDVMNLKRLVAARRDAGPTAPPDYDAPALEGENA